MGPLRNVGAYIKPVKALKPQALAAGAANGAAIDRMPSGKRDAYMSCTLHVARGDTSSNPSVHTIDCKLQESADGSTGWTDITGAAIAQLGTNDTEAEVDVNLGGVKQYIRAVTTAAFTGGSTPSIPVAVTVILGGAKELPAS